MPAYAGKTATGHTLFSIYSQDDATRRLLMSWLALVIIIVTFLVVIGIFLKRKDARG